MIRALYTAASGMAAQQANIDTVAHNLANVNTNGFKKSRMEFEDLVYQQTLVAGTPTSSSTEAPVGLETGLGQRTDHLHVQRNPHLPHHSG
jgi:flagellar basal-body rod protein FlgG